jgi:hypothetical protein
MGTTALVDFRSVGLHSAPDTAAVHGQPLLGEQLGDMLVGQGGTANTNGRP